MSAETEISDGLVPETSEVVDESNTNSNSNSVTFVYKVEDDNSYASTSDDSWLSEYAPDMIAIHDTGKTVTQAMFDAFRSYFCFCTLCISFFLLTFVYLCT